MLGWLLSSACLCIGLLCLLKYQNTGDPLNLCACFALVMCSILGSMVASNEDK